MLSILMVCGNGCGSSLVCQMAVEAVLKENWVYRPRSITAICFPPLPRPLIFSSPVSISNRTLINSILFPTRFI